MPSSAAPRHACPRGHEGRSATQASASSSARFHCSRWAYAELRFERSTGWSPPPWSRFRPVLYQDTALANRLSPSACEPQLCASYAFCWGHGDRRSEMSHLVALGVAVLGCAVLHVRFFSHVHPILSPGPEEFVFFDSSIQQFKFFKNLMVGRTASRLPQSKADY